MKGSSETKKNTTSKTKAFKKRSPFNKKKYAQKKRQNIELQKKLLSAGGIALLLIFFALCVLFMGQLYVISNLDSEVTELQDSYDSIRELNESRDGQIIEKLGYPQIEAMAAEYGMCSPSEEQLVTETVTVQKIDESGWNQTKWYHRFLQ